jgi:DNA-binding transcriptional LysR family regulator
VPVSGNLSANEDTSLLRAALQGAGIVLQPRYSVMALIARGELLPLLESFTPQQMGIHAIYTSRQHMPAALRAMLDFWPTGSAMMPAGWPTRRRRAAPPARAGQPG